MSAWVFGQSDGLSPAELEWLGTRIFANECNQALDCLTAWNAGEDFPSLGIGHFIWFPAGQDSPFSETFPALLRYYEDRGVALPPWLAALPTPDAPWQDREQFRASQQSAEMVELRDFLARTVDVQVAFIVQRLDTSLPDLLAASPAGQRDTIAAIFRQLQQASPPLGYYALIDYVHFKGTGTNPAERYRDQGWGLLQVLQRMQPDRVDVAQFVAVAGQLLRERVDNAPAERNEQRWLQGWLNRLQTYLQPPALGRTSSPHRLPELAGPAI